MARRLQNMMRMRRALKKPRDALRRRPACRPTVEEIRRHQATHLPFRDWCPECTAGSADDLPHHHTGIETEVLSIAEMHCDYCFPKDHKGADYAVVLVDRDRETGMTVSRVVPVKGGDQEWVAEQLARDILQLGLQGDFTLKSYLEPDIVDLLKQVVKLRGVGRKPSWSNHQWETPKRMSWPKEPYNLRRRWYVCTSWLSRT